MRVRCGFIGRTAKSSYKDWRVQCQDVLTEIQWCYYLFFRGEKRKKAGYKPRVPGCQTLEHNIGNQYTQ